MTDEQKLDKLQSMVKQQMSNMVTTLSTMYEVFEESGDSADIDKYFEDLALAHHRLIQMTSLYGYFQMLSAGEDPLERM